MLLDLKIQNFGEYRAWEDGTFAKSCEFYRYPPRFYNYDGAVYSLYIYHKLGWQWSL